MKKVLLLFILVLCQYSCSPYEEMEGDWILAYYITVNGQDQSINNDCAFLSIEGSKWKTLECKRPDTGVESKEQVFSFKRKGNKLYFRGLNDNTFEIVTLSKDSMVVQVYDTTSNLKFVYKRLPLKSSRNWDVRNKSFRFIGNNGEAYWDFFSDTLMIEHSIGQKDYHSKEWWTENFEDYTFLVLNQIDAPQPILIDSVRTESVYVSVIDTKFSNYELEMIKPEEGIREKLIGTWKLSNDLPVPRPPESFAFKFEKFEIMKENIHAGDGISVVKTDWILSADSETILFPIEKSRKFKYWKIMELTNDRIHLDMPDVFLNDINQGVKQNRVIRSYRKVKD
ncbi:MULTISPECIES: hypothetical protein [Maribacter]|uniref:Lipocalin family protein n=1 Tax=Maribacter flavus TaxID=1658664 RepID=A0ABU7IKW2_9FLAO|nr:MULTISPECIES: hypothetical protein [Maribacter]MDC6406173.1 hypothetical protein [Maribacter sp. PR66]MEE1973293.1 hypothetical protein [Maribacter flavus]